ncbi:MAG: transposase [Phycisphaerae bacterium]
MLTFTDEQLDWLVARLPISERNPKGGRPEADRRRTLQGIFWILDNGAKWKDLPRQFGSKSTVHRWFQIWTTAGVFERILQEAGQCVERAAATSCMNATLTPRSPGPRAAATASVARRPEKA